MKLKLLRWPDGRVPILKDPVLPNGYGRLRWTSQWNDAKLLKVVCGLSREIGRPIRRIDVFFVLVNALAHRVLFTSNRGRPLELAHERWFATNFVADWMVASAPRTLDAVFPRRSRGEPIEQQFELLRSYVHWSSRTWGPIEADFFDRWREWAAAKSDRGRELGEAYYETPKGALVLLHRVLVGAPAEVDHIRRLARTLDRVVRDLVGTPTTDDEQAVTAAILERNAGKSPLRWFLDKGGRRLLVDKRALLKLVVHALSLKKATKTAPDGSKRRVYVRSKPPEHVVQIERRGRHVAPLDEEEAEPLAAETIREQREVAEHIRALRRALEDDPVGRAEFLMYSEGLTAKDAALRAGVSERRVLAAVRGQRLRRRYDKYWDARTG